MEDLCSPLEHRHSNCPQSRPRPAPQQLQLAAVPLPLVRSCQLELVPPVDVEDGGGEVWVGGELHWWSLDQQRPGLAPQAQPGPKLRPLLVL